ncbi:MAG: hypothetical protein KGL39_27645 [Patescibacteria group bacterium]|nr:hypothetical protein [Patescibacteria group bacterium]
MNVALTLATASTVTIGYAGGTGALLPASAACTTTVLAAADCFYAPGGLQQSAAALNHLTLTTTQAVTAGQLEVVIRYVRFVDMPNYRIGTRRRAKLKRF